MLCFFHHFRQVLAVEYKYEKITAGCIPYNVIKTQDSFKKQICNKVQNHLCRSTFKKIDINFYALLATHGIYPFDVLCNTR